MTLKPKNDAATTAEKIMVMPLSTWEQDRLQRPYDIGIGYEAESRIVGGAGPDRHHRR
jgi:hypothetical protein